ncbi:hypothetical protein [Pseudomonas sp. BN411]|uniref:hypothetical protein n=1 Tax=Pseudomonas sp. BN411 TaxID=2567887 RepID=UPI0024558D05|nr:hypothetical protein [Pseudomonas sp. BN411]MDH4560649.1 hypothetical protein [Pseudomonas sp. BN411]
MEISLPAWLVNNLGIAAFLGAVALVGKSLQIAKGLFDFHYDYFTRRHLRRAAELLPLVEPTSQHHQFLQQVIAGEVFKIASGVDAVGRKAEILMHLRQSGLVRTSQMKKMARFIEPSTDGQAEIRIGIGDWLLIGYSLVASTVIFLFGLFVFLRLAFSDDPFAWIAGSGLFLISALVSRLLSSDYRVYRALKRLNVEMANKPFPASEKNSPTPHDSPSPPLPTANVQEEVIGALP